MSDEQRFGIILSLEDDDFENDLKTAASLTRAIAKQMKEDTTIKLDYSGEELASTLVVLRTRLAGVNDEIKHTTDQPTLDKLNTEAEDLNNTIQFIIENYKRFLAEGEKTPKKLTMSLEASVKQATKLALSLIGIRGIWSALRRASSTYLNDNKVINEQLKITFNILSQAIGPAIKTLVNIVEYGAIVIAKLIQAFTRVNILEKAQAATLKDLAKAAKKAHSALASFDTISNLSDNSDALEDYNAALEAYNDFVDKMGEVENFWNKWGDWVEAGAAALGILWGAKTLGGLAKLIGAAGTATTAGSGLLGVSSLLSGIATIGVITITIWAIIKGYERFMQVKAFIEKWTPEYIEERVNAIEDVEDVTEYIADNTEEIKDNVAIIGENYNFWHDLVGGITGEQKESLKNAQDIVNSTSKIIEKVQEIQDKEKLTKDQAQKLLDYLIQQYRINAEIETQLSLQGKDTKKVKEEQEDLLDKVIEIRDQYGVSSDYIFTIKDGIKEINGIHITDKYVKVNIEADTSSAERTTNGWFTNLKNSFSSFFDRLQMQSILPHFKLFDVGTNYVPQDMPAIVHKGEMIVPAKYNPMTSGIGGTNEETNDLLRQLNSTLEQKQFNGYISASEITNTAINGINQRSRQMGRSVIR